MVLVSKIIKKTRCFFYGCSMEIVSDKHGLVSDLDTSQKLFGHRPARHVIFRCPYCGKTDEFFRWAVLAGSGSLHFFYGKYWGYTSVTLEDELK